MDALVGQYLQFEKLLPVDLSILNSLIDPKDPEFNKYHAASNIIKGQYVFDTSCGDTNHRYELMMASVARSLKQSLSINANQEEEASTKGTLASIYAAG